MVRVPVISLLGIIIVRDTDIRMRRPTKRASRSSSSDREQKDGPPRLRGWISTDEDEVRRREWRGRTEIDAIRYLDDAEQLFGDYLVTSSSGADYTVEIRSFARRQNSCDCRDHLTNGLGTCKHVEAVRSKLDPRGGRARRGEASDRIEVYVDRGGEGGLTVYAPEPKPPLFDAVNRLCRGARDGSPNACVALRDLARANAGQIRVSRQVEGWAAARYARKRRQRDREQFEAELRSGAATMNLLKHPLLPYQVAGALHLAFGERAMLADDMGLGKTVQAIAACALLAELRGVRRVLVVSPASLKEEWREQISRFSDFETTLVFGNPGERRRAYDRNAFFTLCNYEQVIADGPDLPNRLQPEVVILDEAQRIKNWRTKTAAAVKGLDSPYAFVLTGTPLENRIDDIYSIMQFLDPELLGPLFRFNRNFYQLDERGRAVGYRNLDELARRVSSVMLRRRKEDVDSELPARSVKTYFVPMTADQQSFYEDYERLVARLAALSSKRPLTREEFERLQRYLACMRMVCDTPAILGDGEFECPKLDEIRQLFPDLLARPGRKIIVFSEWVRMLALVREYAQEQNIEFAWHTGEVPQQRRRNEIRRFREDPDCRLFLSSESGGVGLNLQVADTVVNLDQPWNPARLEQRIARAWRKYQTQPVTVINLVSEDTIEHRMLGVIEQKRALADGVLDGRGGLTEIRLPGGRAAFMEQVNAVLQRDPAQAREQADGGDPKDRLRQHFVDAFDEGLDRLLVAEDGKSALAVVSPDSDVAGEEKRLAAATGLHVHIVDPESYETMRRLAAAGLIAWAGSGMTEIHSPPAPEDISRQRASQASRLLEQARRKLQAASLLFGGGFAEESRIPAIDAVTLGAGALAAVRGHDQPEQPDSVAAYLGGSEVSVPDDVLDRSLNLLHDDNADEPVEPAETLLDWIGQEISG